MKKLLVVAIALLVLVVPATASARHSDPYVGDLSEERLDRARARAFVFLNAELRVAKAFGSADARITQADASFAPKRLVLEYTVESSRYKVHSRVRFSGLRPIPGRSGVQVVFRNTEYYGG